MKNPNLRTATAKPNEVSRQATQVIGSASNAWETLRLLDEEFKQKQIEKFEKAGK
jgi:hypothetical protein